MIYAAYGMNLCPDYMSGATELGGATLYGWRYGFRFYADVQPDPSAATPVGLWDITEEHLGILDRREGYPRMYERSEVEVMRHDTHGTRVIAWVYHMATAGPLELPSDHYLQLIQEGYERLNLNRIILDRALDAAATAERWTYGR